MDITTFGSPARGLLSSENRPSFSYWYEGREIARRHASNGEIMAVRASLSPKSCTLKLRRHLPDLGFGRNSGIVVIWCQRTRWRRLIHASASP